jgi:D-aminopeptidase
VTGIPVGRQLGRTGTGRAAEARQDDGSVIIVVATDAPLSDRNLRRLASRAMMGLGRTGSSAGNGSGDYVIAFSTNPSVRRDARARGLTPRELANGEVSVLFQAVVEATEEAIYNALFMATTVEGNGNRAEAIPLEEVRRILAASRR